MIKFRIHYLLLLSFFTFATCNFAFGQRFGYADIEFVLSKMPEYQKAQTELNTISAKWQEEIQSKTKEIEALYNKLQAEEVLLTKAMKQERLQQIQQKEKEVKEYHSKVFGYEGLLFLKKKELTKPVQDMVYKAVRKVARDNRLQMVFDKSGDLVMIYTDPIYDFTEEVLVELGIGEGAASDENATVEGQKKDNIEKSLNK